LRLIHSSLIALCSLFCPTFRTPQPLCRLCDALGVAREIKVRAIGLVGSLSCLDLRGKSEVKALTLKNCDLLKISRVFLGSLLLRASRG